MDAATLEAVMVDPGVARVLQPSRAVYERYVGPCNAAMIAAGCTTVARAAMWCAQIGHESVGLKFMKELGDAAYFARYNNRASLGNGPKDGPVYPGRGPLQITGRLNYGRFSAWCHTQTNEHGTQLVGTPTWFVDYPADLEFPRWGFLAASWYWTVERPLLNHHADVGDILAASKAINGVNPATGLPNGMDDRKARYARALALGARLLPGSVEWVDVEAALPVLMQGDGYPPAPPPVVAAPAPPVVVVVVPAPVEESPPPVDEPATPAPADPVRGGFLAWLIDLITRWRLR